MNDVAHDTREHSELAPSAASRWMVCPGSIRLCRIVPPAPSSSYAAEGTLAHELAEYCLAKGKSASDDMSGTIFRGMLLDQEFCDSVQVYLDYVLSLLRGGPQ